MEDRGWTASILFLFLLSTLRARSSILHRRSSLFDWQRNRSMKKKSVLESVHGEDLNPYHIAALQFDRAAALMPQLKRGLIDFLKRPARTVILEFPIELEDGSV